MKQLQPKKRPLDSQPRAPKPKKQKKSKGKNEKNSFKYQNLLFLDSTRFINDRPAKNELNLSEDESEASHITEENSDDDGIVLPVDDDYEEKNGDPEGVDYVPSQGTSSRGRKIKPNF